MALAFGFLPYLSSHSDFPQWCSCKPNKSFSLQVTFGHFLSCWFIIVIEGRICKTEWPRSEPLFKNGVSCFPTQLCIFYTWVSSGPLPLTSAWLSHHSHQPIVQKLGFCRRWKILICHCFNQILKGWRIFDSWIQSFQSTIVGSYGRSPYRIEEGENTGF